MMDTRVAKPRIYKLGASWFVWYDYASRPRRFASWGQCLDFVGIIWASRELSEAIFRCRI